MLHRLTFLILCLLLLPSPVRAQNRTVSVPPGLYTLDELAVRLSLPNAPVKASVVVARRLAFAHLKERSQDDALRLMEAAFAVRANPQPSPGQGFVLVDDPDVIKRERRWLNRFIPVVQQPVTEMLEDYALLLQMPPEQLIQERDWRGKEQAAMIGKAKVGTPSEQAFTALYKRYFRAMSAVDNRKRLSERIAYLRNKQLLPTLVDETVRRSVSLKGEAFTVRNDTATTADTAYAVTYATFTHVNEDYSFKIWLNVLYPDRKDAFQLTETYGSSLTPFLFGSAKQGDGNAFIPLLGKDAAEWIAVERALTEKFLASEAARKEIKLNPLLPSDAVSSRVWQWCVALDREALVEVWPSVDATEVQGGTLADVLRQRPYWSARDERGVAIVTNRLAFLDRSRSWKLSALQYLAQAPAKLAAASSATTPGTPFANTDAFPLSLLPTFSQRSFEGGNYVAWSWPGIARSRNYYYRYEPHILDQAAAIGLLWTNLPKGQQVPKPGGILPERTEVPLSAFSEPTLRLLAQWFESTGTSVARHPGFLNYLKQSARLVIEPGNIRLVKAAVVFDDRKAPLHPELLPILTISLDR